MDRYLLLVIWIVLGLVLVGLLPLGWWRRKRRQGNLVQPLAAPATLGDVMGSFGGKYVATTIAGDPLNRVAVRGLGFRGSAMLTISTDGILLEIAGSKGAWIPLADLRGTRRATWTIDRVVEPDGMNLLEWMLGDTAVDTYLRMDDPAAVDRALATLNFERHPA